MAVRVARVPRALHQSLIGDWPASLPSFMSLICFVSSKVGFISFYPCLIPSRFEREGTSGQHLLGSRSRATRFLCLPESLLVLALRSSHGACKAPHNKRNGKREKENEVVKDTNSDARIEPRGEIKLLLGAGGVCALFCFCWRESLELLMPSARRVFV